MIARQVRPWAPGTWRPTLGQAQEGALEIVVVDANGTPVKNALVSAGKVSAYTDEAGIVRLPISGTSAVSVDVQKDVYRFSKMVQPGTPGAPVYISLPVQIPPNGIKTADLVIFVAGIGLVGAGAFWKLDPLKLVGEVVVSAVIFSMIYRLAAR